MTWLGSSEFLLFLIAFFIFIVVNQSFYLVTASTINNILLRKDMCHWSKGVQIRWVNFVIFV